MSSVTKDTNFWGRQSGSNSQFSSSVQQSIFRSHLGRRQRMQVSESGKVGSISLTISRYNSPCLDNNYIGDQGCKQLRHAKWPQLAILDLGTNEVRVGVNLIKAEGCKYLSMAKWEQLKELFLRKRG